MPIHVFRQNTRISVCCVRDRPYTCTVYASELSAKYKRRSLLCFRSRSCWLASATCIGANSLVQLQLTQCAVRFFVFRKSRKCLSCRCLSLLYTLTCACVQNAAVFSFALRSSHWLLSAQLDLKHTLAALMPALHSIAPCCSHSTQPVQTLSLLFLATWCRFPFALPSFASPTFSQFLLIATMIIFSDFVCESMLFSLLTHIQLYSRTSYFTNSKATRILPPIFSSSMPNLKFSDSFNRILFLQFISIVINNNQYANACGLINFTISVHIN